MIATTNVDVIAAIAGGLLVARSFGGIAVRVISLRWRMSRVTLERKDGSKIVFDWKPRDPAQAEQLARLLLDDKIISVEAEKRGGSQGGDEPSQ